MADEGTQDKDLHEDKQDKDLQTKDPGQDEGKQKDDAPAKGSFQEKFDKIYGKMKHFERTSEEGNKLLEDSQKDNKLLAGTVDKLIKQLEEDKKELKADIKDTFGGEQGKSVMDTLQGELDKAVEEEDTAKAIKIQGQIFSEQLKVMKEDSKKDIKDVQDASDKKNTKGVADTVFNDWVKDNDWYNKNDNAKRYADYLSGTFDPDKKLDTLTFFNEIGKQVQTAFPDIKSGEAKKGPASVEGGDYGKKNNDGDNKLSAEELGVCERYGTDPKAYASQKGVE